MISDVCDVLMNITLTVLVIAGAIFLLIGMWQMAAGWLV